MPSRDDGFAIMDVSTSICDDPKFRRIARERPDLVGVAFTAYLATMAESWRIGRRVGIEDAWPAVLPYDAEAAALLIAVGLLDKRGVLSPKAWRGWFEPARNRRDKSRADWRKWQALHRQGQGGVSTDTDPDKSIPSVPPVRPPGPTGSSVPPVNGAGARQEKDDGLKTQRTREQALAELSERFQRNELTELEYGRQRKALGAA